MSSCHLKLETSSWRCVNTLLMRGSTSLRVEGPSEERAIVSFSSSATMSILVWREMNPWGMGSPSRFSIHV